MERQGSHRSPGTFANGKADFTGSGYTATIGAEGATLSGKTDKASSSRSQRSSAKAPRKARLRPAGATVLFDGNGVIVLEGWYREMDARMFFQTRGATSTAGAITKSAFQDPLHLEFREPFQPALRAPPEATAGSICKADTRCRCWIPSAPPGHRGGHHGAQSGNAAPSSSISDPS